MLLALPVSLVAQDIHFSHIHASPTALNPAMNGLINGGDIRFIVNARSQWNSFTKGYKTAAGSMDMKLINAGNGSIIGAGLQLAADKAGDLDFTTLYAGLSVSAMKTLDRKGQNIISFGLQGAYIGNSMDYSKMVGFQEETFMHEGVPDRIRYLNLNAGLGWFYQVSRHHSFYLGASLSHINKPNVSFMAANSMEHADPDDVIPLFRKLLLHGGGHFRMKRNLSLVPSFIFVDQGPHREISIGTFIKMKKQTAYKSKDTAFYLGGWMRFYAEMDLVGKDAFVASCRLDHRQTYYTISFDLNMSKLNRVSHGMGGPELSVIKVLDTGRRLPGSSRVTCPVF